MGLSTTYTKVETDFLIQQLEKKTASGYRGDLNKTEAAPTEIGFYGLLETGIYTNLGGIDAQSGKLNFASFDGTTWKLIEVEIPNFVAPINNLTSTSTTNPLSSNMGRELDEKKLDKGIKDVPLYLERDYDYNVGVNVTPWNISFNNVSIPKDGYIYAFRIGLTEISPTSKIIPFICDYDGNTTVTNYEEIEEISGDKFINDNYFIKLTTPKQVNKGKYFGVKCVDVNFKGKGGLSGDYSVVGLTNSNTFQQKIFEFEFKKQFWLFENKSETNTALIDLVNDLYLNQYQTILTQFESLDFKQRMETVKNNNEKVVYKLKKFFGKFKNMQLNADGYTKNSANIVCVGDSIWGLTQHTSPVTDESIMPPSLTSLNAMTRLYLKMSKHNNTAQYRRYDNSGMFTENGTFTTITDVGQGYNWYDLNGGACHTRVGNTNGCKVSFSINSEFPTFNFIDRTSINGVNQTISISQGNGYLQVYNGSNWVEANGYVFTQLETDTSIRSNSTYQRRIYFRKNAGHSSDTINITITSSGSLLMYWGLELYNTNYFQFINIGHGGRDINEYKGYIENEVYDRNPDLLILELPLLNMIPYLTDMNDLRNRLDEFIFGDGRNGSPINSNSLMNKSNNWQDFDVLFVIPNFAQDYYSGNDYAEAPMGIYKRMDYYKFAYGYLISNDLAVISIADSMLKYIGISNDFNTIQKYVLASGISGKTFLNEGIHPNNFGAEFISEMLNIFK